MDSLKKSSKKIREKEKNKHQHEKKPDLSSYKDESVKIERGLGYYINLIFSTLAEIPKSLKKRIDNIAILKQIRNKKAFDTKTMLVDFSDEDKENEGKKVVWEYIAINSKGKKIKGYFEAFSRVDVQSFLMGEGLAIYSIRTSKLIQALHKDLGGSKQKIKIKDLIFLLTQLSTYLKAGIPLVEALNILIKQTQKKTYKVILRAVKVLV